MDDSRGSADGALIPLADGVWVGEAPVRFLGMHLTSTMTVLRLGDGSLLVHSPIELTPERRAAVEALGPVAHLYAPNLWHHLRLGEWISAFPTARVHAPRGLEKKRPDVRIDRVLGSSPEPAFADVVDEVSIDGFRLGETDVFHRPSRTLVVADLVHNIGRPTHGWTVFYTRTMGFYDRAGLSRFLRWTAFSDRRAARRCVDQVLALPFERLVLGHGAPLVENARDVLATAYVWLPRSS
jgi:hypothetical protein